MILSLSLSLAVPALRPALETVRADAASRRTAAFLDGVRRRAVLERRELRVRCDLDGNRLEAEGAKPLLIPHQVALVACSPRQLTYSPRGSASGAMRLELRDRNGRGRWLTVGSFTGLARIEAPP